MKKDEFEKKVVNEIMQKCRDVLIQRGGQYAGKDDYLENFKREAARKTTLGFQFNGRPLEPEHVALWFTDTKVDRWANRLRLGKDPADDWVDGINYILLGAGCHLECNVFITDDRKDFAMIDEYKDAGAGFQVLVSNVLHRKCGNCGMFSRNGREIKVPTCKPIWTCEYCIKTEGEANIRLGYEKM